MRHSTTWEWIGKALFVSINWRWKLAISSPVQVAKISKSWVMEPSRLTDVYVTLSFSSFLQYESQSICFPNVRALLQMKYSLNCFLNSSYSGQRKLDSMVSGGSLCFGIKSSHASHYMISWYSRLDLSSYCYLKTYWRKFEIKKNKYFFRK